MAFFGARSRKIIEPVSQKVWLKMLIFRLSDEHQNEKFKLKQTVDLFSVIDMIKKLMGG